MERRERIEKEESEDDSLENVSQKGTQSSQREEKEGVVKEKDIIKEQKEEKNYQEEKNKELLRTRDKEVGKEADDLERELKQAREKELFFLKEREKDRERQREIFGERSPFTDRGKMPRRSNDRRSGSLIDRFNKNFLEEEERRESRALSPNFFARGLQKRVNWDKEEEAEIGVKKRVFSAWPTSSASDEEDSGDMNHNKIGFRGVSIPKVNAQMVTGARKELKIVPYVRMRDLSEFYMERRPLESLIKEDIKQKGMSEDLKAQWAIEQFRNAAGHLGVMQFIDESGKDIPKIPEMDEYMNAYMEKSRATMEAMDEVIDEKRTLIKLWVESYNELVDGEWDQEVTKENIHQTMVDIKTKIKKEKIELMDLVKGREQILDRNLQSAAKQRDDDEGALIRLKGSIDHLKKFLGDLIRKVPSIESQVRWKGTDGYNQDPFEAGDMKRVLANLNFHYRSTNGLGKMTLLISGMRDHQGNKSAAQHLIAKEEWLNTLVSVGIKTIEVGELVALATIALFNDDHRDAFIQSEMQLNQTMESMDGNGKIKQKTMMMRVQGFVHNLDQRDVLGSRLRQERVGSQDSIKVKKDENQVKLRREAVDVMAVNGAHNCPNVKKYGVCIHGDNCRFLKKNAPKVNDGMCNLWKAGNCRFGDGCRFKHGGNQVNPKQQQGQERVSEAKETGNRAPSSAVSFSALRSGWGGQRAIDEDESDFCVVETFDTVNSVKEVKGSMMLGWDSMASIHVAKSLEILREPTLVEKACLVNGLGGERMVTHEGMCPAFNLKMKFIQDGGTPNLMSLAKVLEEDEKGFKGIAIFTDKEAVRFRAYPGVVEKVQAVIDAITNEGLVEGYAEVRSGVYQQSFQKDECADGDQAMAVTSMYASRVPLSSGEELIGMLASAGVTEEALVKGVREGSIKGLPHGINENEVRRFFLRVGKDLEQIKGEIIHAPLREPIDYQREGATKPGEVLVIDAFDPSFSRMKGQKGTVRSLGGYRDAVIGVDPYSGVIDVVGRKSPKSPEKIVKIFIDKWLGRWKNLKMIKVDKEFATEDVMRICEIQGVRLRQAVPGEHRRGTGEAEGAIRWLQDQGQVNMNRAVSLARSGRLNGFVEKDARSLWYHAVRHAMFAALMKPCLHVHSVTRFEERFGRVFNLSEMVMLPFSLPMVVRNRIAGNDGRGSMSVYLGPSAVVKGGVITFMTESKRVQQKYSFVPRERMPLVEDLDIIRVAGEVYGDIVGGNNHLGGDPELIEGDVYGDIVGGNNHLGGDPELIEGDVSDCDIVGRENQEKGDQEFIEEDELDHDANNKPITSQPEKRVHKHFTRSKGRALAVGVRPPKPDVPVKHIAMARPEWKRAMERELDKINGEDTIYELPVDEKGEYILPHNPIVMRMFEILDYKWKADPDTGEERWLEVIRAVVDGSSDKRKENSYAETPYRTVLLMMMSFAATLGEKSITGDAVRAYLNAEALDDNLVVVASKYMKDIPKVGILNKGLYGTLKGALGWEKWVEKRIIGVLEFRKCNLTRGLYTHQDGGVITRLYRHSDDFRMSSKDDGMLDVLSQRFSSVVRMSNWTKCDRFLGLTVEHYEDHKICVIRNQEKIMELEKDFGYLRQEFNSGNRKRLVPLPSDVIKSDEELSGGMEEYLDSRGKVDYMKLVGKIGYISTTLRHDCRYGYLIISRRLARPRRWDLHLAVWIMEYLVYSQDIPLILGGDGINLEAVSDASFATLEMRKSVKAHMLKTNDLSGAIYVHVGAVKNIVTSVWEAEINAASDAVDTMTYAINVCRDLGYNPGMNKVLVDNQSAINWLNGDNISASTRHVDIRMYRLRQVLKQQIINLEYVRSEENDADLFTKALPVNQFRVLMEKVMGHGLVRGDLKIRGIKHWEDAT